MASGHGENQLCRRRVGLLLPAALMAALARYGSLGFAAAAGQAQSTATLRGSGISPAAFGASADSARARHPGVARGDGLDFSDPIVPITIGAVIAGLATGVILSKAMENASDQSAAPASMKARLSAAAGMEDVEDDVGADTKQQELIEQMQRAQGMSEEEVAAAVVKKVKMDDGW
mmetsp:Transcript_64955/g.104964  ORF Transcript_64955/g.104964 Transcript_64955/m.104964 type:complete len:175 (+) Transcript_64955:81-605(+)